MNNNPIPSPGTDRQVPLPPVPPPPRPNTPQRPTGAPQEPKTLKLKKKKNKRGCLYAILGIGAFLILTAVIVLAIIFVVHNSHFEFHTENIEYTDEDELVSLPEEYQSVGPLEVSVRPADHLAPQGDNTYNPENLLDGNPATAWVVNSQDSRYGNSIDLLQFDLDAQYIDHIVITNGYAKSMQVFHNNARAGSVYISRVPWDEAMSSDILYAGSLSDTMEPQILEVNSNYNNSIPTRKIYVRFGDDVVQGAKYPDDFCISEIQFFGY